MLFNEKYGISHIDFNSGRITIDFNNEGISPNNTDGFDGLLRGFSKLIGGEIESLGMMQYKAANSPYDFIFQRDNQYGSVIVVENMRQIDETVKYIKNSLAEINLNMLYEDFI